MNFFFTSIDTKEAVEAKKKYQNKYGLNDINKAINEFLLPER